MGTKKVLAPIVAAAVSEGRDGAILDAFSGMCAVGQSVSINRQVWNNDIQRFAATVARALFTSTQLLPTLSVTLDWHYPFFEEQLGRLERRFRLHIQREEAAIQKQSFRALLACSKATESFFSGAHCRSVRRSRRNASERSYDLFALLYGGTYFGWKQCIEIDSIIFAIDTCIQRELISEQQKDWLVVALGQAMLRVATTTGHFAQYTPVKAHTISRFVNQRKRSIWAEWSRILPSLSPVHSTNWRKRNRVFNEDSLSLVHRLRRSRGRPGVIYADPPYTNDQYSRYYHIFETLILYDYPDVTGFARYRSNRFSTPFSLSREVEGAFHRFTGDCAFLRSDLILSYPTTGLLHQIGSNPLHILRQHYRRAEVFHQGILNHSTLGASKGAAKNVAVEVIYRAWS